MTAVSFRPYLPADAVRCAEIFRDAIEITAADDYDEDQRAAWAARADDEELVRRKACGAAHHRRDAGRFVVAFASLKGVDELDMLYVDPAAGRQGVGSALVDAVERLARARGAKRLRRGERRVEAAVRAPEIRRRSPEPRAARRAMAPPHLDDQNARRRTRARNPTLTRTRHGQGTPLSLRHDVA